MTQSRRSLPILLVIFSLSMCWHRIQVNLRVILLIVYCKENVNLWNYLFTSLVRQSSNSLHLLATHTVSCLIQRDSVIILESTPNNNVTNQRLIYYMNGFIECLDKRAECVGKNEWTHVNRWSIPGEQRM